ncbi:amidohydrolase family protein [Mesotoga sp.]|uniref:dihydroorotase n=1 Tax=Mesotoga sp. TaxID=2053577 RepID=UPI001BD2A89C
MTFDLALENGTICAGDSVFPANLYVSGEEIAAISATPSSFPAREILDCSGLFLLPGFIDPHVHLSLNLGRYTSVDDFDSGSALAISGGVTTLIDFLDPVSSLLDFEKAKKSRMQTAADSRIDYAFHVTLAGSPRFSAEEIARAAIAEKMPSIKIFTTYSSSDRRTSDGMILNLLSLSRKLGFVLLAHAENDEIITETVSGFVSPTFKDLSDLRPTISEMTEVVKLALMSMDKQGQLYIVHLSSGETAKTLGSINVNWKDSTRLETCPQYLLLDNSPLLGEQGYLNTYCPPPRSAQERLLLVSSLREGEISSMGTDHCPFLRQDKLENRDDYLSMPNGSGSLGLSFSTANTLLEGDLTRVSSLLSTNAAKTFGLFPKRGLLAPGSIADIAVVDKDAEITVSRSPFTRSDHSLFDGMKLKGRVEAVVQRGRVAYKDGEVLLPRASGRFIERESIRWEDASCK